MKEKSTSIQVCAIVLHTDGNDLEYSIHYLYSIHCASQKIKMQYNIGLKMNTYYVIPDSNCLLCLLCKFIRTPPPTVRFVPQRALTDNIDDYQNHVKVSVMVHFLFRIYL